MIPMLFFHVGWEKMIQSLICWFHSGMIFLILGFLVAPYLPLLGRASDTCFLDVAPRDLKFWINAVGRLLLKIFKDEIALVIHIYMEIIH